MCAGSVNVSTTPIPGGSAGSNPSPALHQLDVRPIPSAVAKVILVRCHYLGSLPGGTKLAFGVFVGQQLMGAVTFGVGPYLVYQLVEGTTPDDVVCLTRLWLSDALPRNSESYVLGVITRALRRHTSLKFLVAYSDPGAGHVGAIYQAANWLYTGLSSATPLYDIGDGIARHSRSLAHHYGSHSIRHFAEHGVGVKLVPQSAKHRYLYILDRALRSRLTVPVLRYPRREVIDEGY